MTAVTSSSPKRVKVGELRPSQVLTTFGIGSIIDLPNLAVIVMGLEDWPLHDTVEIGEERLLTTVRRTLGPQVQALRSVPVPPDGQRINALDPSTLIGVPVAPFPRWMVCPYCRRLAPLSQGVFRLETPYRTDLVRYVHTNCTKPGKPPALLPARFLVVCKNGHLDDFPWREFVHRGPTSCRGGLKLFELGTTGEASEVDVRCEGEGCGKSRRMSDAFKRDTDALPRCRGRRPHLRDFADTPCKTAEGKEMPLVAMLQGASNSWFPILLSALAIPQVSGELAQLVVDHWPVLGQAQSQREVELLRRVHPQLRDFAEFEDLEIWAEIEKKKSGSVASIEEPQDLKQPEWEVFSEPLRAQQGRDFKLALGQVPARYELLFDKLVLAKRLREVRALLGFSRVESPSDYDNPAAFPECQRASLSRAKPTWVPATEIRGEGLFFQFREEAITKWVSKQRDHDSMFVQAHRRWREARHLTPPDQYYPELRFVLLHSFAHALIRQLSVECGYTAAALRERVYSREPDTGMEPMAGVLIYTAAPDSEGTLGGLVSLGEKPATLQRHLDQALDAMRLCASDPLCAEHHPLRDGITLHGAACHACLFAPETSCERGNKYLDRSVLVPTVHAEGLAFFNVE